MSGIWMEWNKCVDGFVQGYCPIPAGLDFTVQFRCRDFCDGRWENERHPMYWYDIGARSDVVRFRINKAKEATA